MGDYLGIIIEQSLRDPAMTSQLRIIATKQPRSWVFLLASVPEADLDRQIALLQSAMVTDDHWYAHYFRDEELVVVFRDALFQVSTDPISWGPAVEYGLAVGIPREQLDFTPRTRTDAMQFFAADRT